MTATSTSRLLKTSKVSQILGWDNETVRRRIRAGHLTALKIGDRYYVEPEEIERFLAAGRSAAARQQEGAL